MHFSTIAALTSLVASAAAIQTIYIGVKQEDCGSGSVKGGRYDLWFSDSNICSDGLVTGYPRFATSLCAENYTILGHDKITFTGCTPPNMGSLGLPTGVSDDGHPALTCRTVENPQKITGCPNDCGYPNSPFTVDPLLYCS